MKSKVSAAVSALVSILMVFAIIGSAGVIFADRIYTPEFFTEQVERSDTYVNAYNSLMKGFEDNYSVSDIPSEVYEKAFSDEWMRDAVNEKIHSAFEGREADIDMSAAEESITEYFEEYARENHVMKDETYEKKLAESVTWTKKTALNAADVYRFDVMEKAGILGKLSSYADLARKCIWMCIGGAAVLLIILILLRQPVYWTGTALFAAGLLMGIPAAAVLLTGMIQRFSVKEYTTYNLVTVFLGNVTDMVMITGVAMAAVGAALIVTGIVIGQRRISDKKN